MSEMNDIYDALITGQRAAENLKSWQRHSEGYRSVKNMESVIQQGISAYNKLSANLHDGRKHIECERDEKPTACYCSATSQPPCSFCTDPANDDQEQPQPQAGDAPKFGGEPTSPDLIAFAKKFEGMKITQEVAKPDESKTP